MSLTIIPQISQLLETLTPDAWLTETILQVVFLSLIYFASFFSPKNIFMRHLYNTYSFCHSEFACQVYSLERNRLQYASYYKSEIKSDGWLTLVFVVFFLYLSWTSFFTLLDVCILGVAQHNERYGDRVERSWLRAGLENFICKETDRKYFRPDRLCHNYLTLLLSIAIDNT